MKKNLIILILCVAVLGALCDILALRKELLESGTHLMSAEAMVAHLRTLSVASPSAPSKLVSPVVPTGTVDAHRPISTTDLSLALAELDRLHLLKVQFVGPGGRVTPLFMQFFKLNSDETSRISALLSATENELREASARNAVIVQSSSGAVQVKVSVLADAADRNSNFMSQMDQILGPERAAQFEIYGADQTSRLLKFSPLGRESLG